MFTPQEIRTHIARIEFEQHENNARRAGSAVRHHQRIIDRHGARHLVTGMARHQSCSAQPAECQPACLLISINNSRRLVWYQKQVAVLQLAEPTSSRTPLELLVISLRLLPRWWQERAGQRTEHEICSPEVGATRTNMKRGIVILALLCAFAAVAYFTASKWAIRHETLTFNDPVRNNRPVEVNIAVRRDKEMQANADMVKLPVAILNHGNTVKFTEYSFLADFFAARGYLAVSIQHDLPIDAPMVTKVGEVYAGRHPQYLRGIANIKFVVGEMQKIQPNADYDRLTMVGHSNGCDISMYFAKIYPDQIKKVVTLDNLRVPFMTDGRFKILSFRSKDPQFKTDPGVIPPQGVRERSGITVVQTGYQHTDMSDRGPDDVKSTMQGALDKFLDDESPVRPAVTNAPPLNGWRECRAWASRFSEMRANPRVMKPRKYDAANVTRNDMNVIPNSSPTYLARSPTRASAT
jgi:hypothetical protein